MPLTLYVDGPRWREHLTRMVATHPGVIPVAKGNGYGLGVARLARRAEWLGVDMIAVGTYHEVAEVQQRFSGDILVLEPYRTFLHDVPESPRVVHTVGRRADLVELGARQDRPRVVLEGLTSMRRHGFAVDELRAVGAAPGRVRVEGHALHLPLGVGHAPEIERWLGAVPARRWFVSHVEHDELADLSRQHPDVEFRPRIGTALWLGDRGALRVRATVLDAHAVRRGDRSGYRQRPAFKAGTILVVAGGTAHGIALEAPTASASARQRAAALAKGGLEATGRAMSPYLVDGRQRWFVEPPHMQVSLIFAPAGCAVPRLGDEVDVTVRFSTITCDRITTS
ncbi:MAG: alanine racemase [Propionibacteriales bacterium]|nr:alanine racemase [Propionibacteriales bacterium]